MIAERNGHEEQPVDARADRPATPEPVAHLGLDKVHPHLPSPLAFESFSQIANRPLASAAFVAQFAEIMKQIQPNRQIMEAAQAMLAAQMPAIGTIQKMAAESALTSIGNSLAAITKGLNAPLISPTLLDSMRVAMQAYQPLSRMGAYTHGPAKRESYSSTLTRTGDYFKHHEIEISSFDDLNRRIADLLSRSGPLRLVWRGQQDANWGVHSSLFRRLSQTNGVKPPSSRTKGLQPYPTEDQMVAAEVQILKTARRDWRFDGMSALETFARIQHAGGYSRLIDVTKNPYIAAWFAVESGGDTDQRDARVFAFAGTAPLPDNPTIDDLQIGMDAEWSTYLPPWHYWADTAARQATDWGTGTRRRLWVPSAYDSRISAQNAAFLLDGVPIPSRKLANYFGGPQGPWSRADQLAAGSIHLKTADPTRRPVPNRFNIAPVYTFRIIARAKVEIRRILTDGFGYTRSYVYPDVAMLAEHLKAMDLPSLESLPS